MELLISLGTHGPLTQGEQKLAPCSEKHPPGGNGEHERDDSQDDRGHVGGGAVGGEDQHRRCPQHNGEQGLANRTVDGEGEQGDQTGRGS